MNRLHICVVAALAFYLITSISLASPRNAPWVGTDFEGLNCKGVEQGFGPYDYTSAQDRNYRPGGGDTNQELVEGAHFRPESENLIKARFGSFLGDYQYTLMAFPNHHRALLSLVRFDLEVRNKIRKPEPKETEVECWFQRGINFSPNDWVTYSIYGHYLRKIGQYEKAKSAYEAALKIKPDESKLEYSYGLLLTEMKLYEQAVEHAKKAYELGKPPKGLRDKLTKLGVWK